MPVTLDLIEDGRVLYYQFTDPVEISELLALYKKEAQLRDAVSYPLHSITDFSGLHRIPQNWLQARHGPGLKHTRSGEMLFVGLKPGLKILIDVILKVTRYQRVKLYTSMDEALSYIRSVIQASKQYDTSV